MEENYGYREHSTEVTSPNRLFAEDGKFTSADYIYCRKWLTWRPLQTSQDLISRDLPQNSSAIEKYEQDKSDDDVQTDFELSSVCSSSTLAAVFSGISQSGQCDDDMKKDHLKQTAINVFDFKSAVISPEVKIHDASSFGSVSDFAVHRILNEREEGSFLICNLSTIVDQYNIWKKELPMVEPFYAVKCHPDPIILRLLSSLGCGFDCATMGEIDLVVNGLGEEHNFGSNGKASNLIVYANPAKMESHLKFASDNQVRMTVFDGEDELYKIAAMTDGEHFDLLLRLSTDDKSSICQFSKKFGCPVHDSERLLLIAKSLGLRVAGVSFHVGSGCGDPSAYTTALAHARIVFETAEKLGMEKMNVVDIGGGFPGDSGGYGGEGMPDFPKLAAAVRCGISEFLFACNRKDVRFIAEPGRYFVSACTSVVTKVYSRKGGDDAFQALYVDDGVYGSFNNIIYDHASPIPRKLSLQAKMRSTVLDSLIPTAVFGPTCDGLDQMCSLDSFKLLRCEIGDWLIWDNMGAYTHTASFVFNGYTHVPNKIYCAT
jgi:ornithine decarboxylase